MKTLLIGIFTAFVIVVEGFPHFQQRIPNGDRIPHPCRPNYMWYGVGHKNYKGSGIRNVFGERFEYYGFVWNRCLCEEDSDDDGLTNGQELGDPNCVWTPGDVPERSSSLSHPGICDNDFDSVACQETNSWVDCSTEPDFVCNATTDADVNELQLVMPSTQVPAQDTTYMCAAFDLTTQLPSGDHHLVAVEGHIDNAIVSHHILAYACPDDEGQGIIDAYSTPAPCDMVTSTCSVLIGMWTVGVDGICYHENTGFKLGDNGYKYLVMEYHWNNPELRSDYFDASGMTFYYTSELREYDSGILFVGPSHIQIPPGWEEYNVYGGCSSLCTDRLLSEPVYVTHVFPHMHYSGKILNVHITRADQDDITIDVNPYFYDDPAVVVYDEPFEIRPGDEINVTCIYNSKTVSGYTFFGEATADEMCFAIFIYYPFATSDTFCQTTNGYGFCGGELSIDIFGNGQCDVTDLENHINTYYFPLITSCDSAGLVCSESCNSTIQNIWNHPCFNEDIRPTVMGELGNDVAIYLASCNPPAPIVPGDDGYTIDSATCPGLAVSITVSLEVISAMLALVPLFVHHG